MIALEACDARVKMALMLLISTLSVISGSPARLCCLVLFVTVLLWLGGVEMRGMLGRLRVALRLMLSLVVLQLLFNRSGEAVLSIGHFTLLTRGGVHTAVVTALRLTAVLLSAALVMTGEIRDYLLGMTQWHVPYEIAFMLMVGLRFLPFLREEAQDVMYAVQMRGVDLKKMPLRDRLRVYMSVIVPIVARTVQRSEQMAIAMEARAFRAMDRRTSMRRLKMKKADWLVCLGSLIVLSVIVWGV